MADRVYEDLLVELECPICTNYMSPPIRQCATGHSICEPCRRRLAKCALCQQPFTDSKNITLESLAVKMRYPCINKPAGCDAVLSYTERENHELKCTSKGYKCPLFDKCKWMGKYEDIPAHWASKKNMSKPYGKSNICHTKIKPEAFYANIVNVYGLLFWFKCKLIRSKIYWAVQYVGNEAEADNYSYEVEIFKPGRNKKKIILSDYCQSVALENSQLFVDDACPSLGFDTVNDFLGEDRLLIYYLRVCKNNDGPQVPMGAQALPLTVNKAPTNQNHKKPRSKSKSRGPNSNKKEENKKVAAPQKVMQGKNAKSSDNGFVLL